MGWCYVPEATPCRAPLPNKDVYRCVRAARKKPTRQTHLSAHYRVFVAQKRCCGRSHCRNECAVDSGGGWYRSSYGTALAIFIDDFHTFDTARQTRGFSSFLSSLLRKPRPPPPFEKSEAPKRPEEPVPISVDDVDVGLDILKPAAPDTSASEQSDTEKRLRQLREDAKKNLARARKMREEQKKLNSARGDAGAVASVPSSSGVDLSTSHGETSQTDQDDSAWLVRAPGFEKKKKKKKKKKHKKDHSSSHGEDSTVDTNGVRIKKKKKHKHKHKKRSDSDALTSGGEGVDAVSMPSSRSGLASSRSGGQPSTRTIPSSRSESGGTPARPKPNFPPIAEISSNVGDSGGSRPVETRPPPMTARGPPPMTARGPPPAPTSTPPARPPPAAAPAPPMTARAGGGSIFGNLSAANDRTRPGE